MVLSCLLKKLRIPVFLLLSLTSALWGGVSCTGGTTGGNATIGATGLPTSGGAATDSGIMPPRPDAMPGMGICFDEKTGKIVECPDPKDFPPTDKRYDDNFYRLRYASAKGTSSPKDIPASYEEIGKDLGFVVPLNINEDGTLHFLMEVFFAKDPSDTSKREWIPATSTDAGAQVRMVTLPPEGSGIYKYQDTLVDDVIHLAEKVGDKTIYFSGAWTIKIEKTGLKEGDRVELYLYGKVAEIKGDKFIYEKRKDFSEKQSSLNETAFQEFVQDSETHFLGTFRVMKDLKGFEVKTGSAPPSGIDAVVP